MGEGALAPLTDRRKPVSPFVFLSWNTNSFLQNCRYPEPSANETQQGGTNSVMIIEPDPELTPSFTSARTTSPFGMI